MHARYYSFHTARFLSVDPVKGEVGSSQSWNRYSYVRNSPIVFIDPFGLTRSLWLGYDSETDEKTDSEKEREKAEKAQRFFQYMVYQSLMRGSGGTGRPIFDASPPPSQGYLNVLDKAIQGTAGLTDSLLWGFGEDLRELRGQGGLVDSSSEAYGIGALVSFGVVWGGGPVKGLRALRSTGGRWFRRLVFGRIPRSEWNMRTGFQVFGGTFRFMTHFGHKAKHKVPHHQVEVFGRIWRHKLGDRWWRWTRGDF